MMIIPTAGSLPSLVFAGPLSRAKEVAGRFKELGFDFAVDPSELRVLCGGLLSELAFRRIVNSLALTKHPALVNTLSFVLLIVFLSDATTEVSHFATQ